LNSEAKGKGFFFSSTLRAGQVFSTQAGMPSCCLGSQCISAVPEHKSLISQFTEEASGEAELLAWHVIPTRREAREKAGGNPSEHCSRREAIRLQFS